MAFQFCEQLVSFVASPLRPYIPVPLLKDLSPNSTGQPDQGRRFVCGILTSTERAKDHGQVTDFVALRAMLGCPDENSFWLCAEPIRSGPGFVLSDRTLFEPSPFEEVYDTSEPMAKLKLSEFWGTYVTRVQELVPRLTSEDTLFLVLCGHGSRNGFLAVGDEDAYVEFWPTSLVHAVNGCKADVQLVMAACHSSSWVSPEWNLFTAAAENDGSVSTVAGGCGGGLYTAAFLDELTTGDQHGLQVPEPGCFTIKEEDAKYIGSCKPQTKGSPFAGQQHPIPWLPNRTTPEIMEWLGTLRDGYSKT